MNRIVKIYCLLIGLFTGFAAFAQKADSSRSTLAITLAFGSQTNVSCFGGSNGTAKVQEATGGTAPYAYNWTPGNPIGDGTISVSGLAAGTWTCTATDATGATASRFFTISQPSSLVLSLATKTDVSSPGASDGAASMNNAVGGTAPYSYNWSPGNPTGDGTVSVTNLTAGTYTCMVTDAKSCTSSSTATIGTKLGLNAVSQTNVSCFGGSNGTASVSTFGGTAPYSHNWTPGNPIGDGTQSVLGLSAGSWTCTVTDATNATATKVFVFSQPAAIATSILSQTNVSLPNVADGAASINEPTDGTPPYTYNWTPGNPVGDGTKSVSSLFKGTWTCNISDVNGCSGQQTFIILEKLKLNSANQSNASCFGGSNGSASVFEPTSGKAPYTYNWTPGNPAGDGTTSVSGLSAGTYTCAVTDALDSTAQQSFTITQPSEIEITDFAHTNVTCLGGSNGSASILAISGGTLPYTFNWTPGNPFGDGTNSVTGLTAGTWTATITDFQGCQKQQSFPITTEFSNQNFSLIRPQDNIISENESFKTTQSITANISIEGASNVLFHAGKFILFDAHQGPFEVKNGVVFEAKIGGCEN